LNRPFIRSLEGQNLLEVFFVTAVASVLGIRFFLAATGYPMLGRGNLHIAHVLLGGLFMMLALVVSLGCINKSSHYLAAVLGGFGFGAFIDELGKFITRDYNYFYQPAVALIYVVFVLLYLGIEALIRRHELTSEERLINALEMTKEVVLEDMDHRERRRALDLLKSCDPADPVTKALRNLLYATESVPVPKPSVYTAAKVRARRLYRRLVKKSWFVNVVIGFFLCQALFALALDAFLLYAKLHWELNLSAAVGFADIAELGSATLAAAMFLAGIWMIRRSRRRGYQLFKGAVLIQIFLVQVFLFYDAQLFALLGLAGNICVLLVLNYMISQERAGRGEAQMGS
jgi:hypothetical protein